MFRKNSMYCYGFSINNDIDIKIYIFIFLKIKYLWYIVNIFVLVLKIIGNELWNNMDWEKDWYD